MSYERLENKLKTITGKKTWAPTPCEILSLTSYSRRNARISEEIENLLDRYNLIAEPTFSNTHCYTHLLIRKKKDQINPKPASKTVEEITGEKKKENNHDPVPRLSRLKTASLIDKDPTSLITIKRDATIEEAVTIMAYHNFSQLPITQDNRQVDGIISWRSIAKAKCFDRQTARVFDYREEVEILDIHTPLLEVVEKVLKNDVILVRNTQKLISGIVTSSDITEQFLAQAEPFFLIEQIEKTLRSMLNKAIDNGKVKLEDMVKLFDAEKISKEIKGVTDLTFGQYVIIFSNEDLFRKINLPIDKKRFHNYLAELNEIRNDVMHFNTDEIEEERLIHLRKTANLLVEITK